VAINPSHPCGRCDYCHEGRGNLCRNMFFLGSASVFPHAQGMFRERFVMGERQLTPVIESEISLGEIACAEPLSIGLHAIQRAGPVLGETVLVTGGGTIGCMSLMARELDYRGAFRAHLEFDWAVQAIRSRRVDVRPLISAQLPLARSKEAFELALDRTRSTKVQLVSE